MKKTVQVSIGGYPFTIETEAFEKLKTYLEEVRNAYSGDSDADEIMKELEERTAELILEKAGKGCVVGIEAVDYAIGRIGRPDELAEEEQSQNEGRQAAPKDTRNNIKDRRLYRDVDNRVLGGVCSGIAAYFGLDVVLIRVIFVLFFAPGFLFEKFFAISVLAYMLLWLIIPAAKTVEEKCKMRGKPLDLGEFKSKVPTQSQVKEFGKEVQTSPALSVAGKVLGIICGVLLVTAGTAGLFGCCAMWSMPDIMHGLIAKSSPSITSNMDVAIMSFLNMRTTWILIATIVGLMSIAFLYAGTMCIFRFQAPKWKPGLILFLLWIIAILVFAGYAFKILALPAILLTV